MSLPLLDLESFINLPENYDSAYEEHDEDTHHDPGQLGKRDRADAINKRELTGFLRLKSMEANMARVAVIDKAVSQGANAVVGLRFDGTAPIGPSHIETMAYGTAVCVKKGNKGADNSEGQQGKGKEEKGKQGNIKGREVGVTILAAVFCGFS